jgi:hypothetical protein
MPADHSDTVKEAIITLLKSDFPVKSIVGKRVYDQPAANPTWPFIRLGLPSTTPYEASRLSGSEHRILIHAFAKGPNLTGVNALTAAIVAAMEDLDLGAVPGPEDISTLEVQWQGTQVLYETDSPVSYHAILNYEIVTAQAA